MSFQMYHNHDRFDCDHCKQYTVLFKELFNLFVKRSCCKSLGALYNLEGALSVRPYDLHTAQLNESSTTAFVL